MAENAKNLRSQVNNLTTTLAKGEVVRLVSNNNVQRAQAGVNLDGLIGVVVVGAVPNQSFDVASMGEYDVLLVPGLALAAGQPLYVSTTAGRATNVAPFLGSVPFAIVKDTSSYALYGTVTAVVGGIGPVNAALSGGVVSRAGMSNIGNTLGQSGVTFGTVVLAASGSNVSLSQQTGPTGATVIVTSPNVVSALGVSGGQSLGNGGLQSGSIFLQGTGAVTLSQSTAPGQVATIIINAAGGTQTGTGIGLSANGSSQTSGVVQLMDSNGVSFGMSDFTVTASIDAFRSIEGPGFTITGPTVSLANGSGVTFGAAGQTITASVAAGATATGNFGGISASGGQITSGTASFANSNGLTFGVAGQTVTGSFSTLSFANSNNVTFGIAGSTLTASFDAGATSLVFSNLALNSTNGGVVSFGQAGSTITARVPGAVGLLRISAGTLDTTYRPLNVGVSNSLQMFWAGNVSHSAADVDTPRLSIQAVALAAGGSTVTSGTVVMSNSNGLTFGLNGSTITGSYTQSTGPAALAASGGTITSGTISFANSNNITFGVNGQTVTASFSATNAAGPSIAASGGTITNGTASFSNANGISFGINGSTVTAQMPAISYIENYPAEFINFTTLGDIQLFMQRLYIPFRMSVTRGEMLWQITNANVSAGASVTMRMGVYTMSGSSAVLASSGSRAWSFNSTLGGSSSYTNISGLRFRSVPLGTWNLTPGDYMFGIVVSIATAVNSGEWDWKCRRNLSLQPEEFGATNVFTRPYFGYGSFSAVTGNLRNTVQLSELSQVNADDLHNQPWFAMVGTF